MYDFYDQQFYHAGSPSKVEATVGSGLLPTNIEYTIADVASFFKKILIGLPGGLFGTVELFEVVRDILINMAPNPEMSSLENTLLRAKLIALAVLSVTSTYRVYLIQAVLGLAAYFGSEAERAEAEGAATDDQEQRHQPTSELMGYQSLGVVLGPLLLGDLTDKVDVSKCESQEAAPRTSTDSMKKSKKQKRSSAQNKLEKDATLSAHVDRANLTASIMQLLLLIWKDVVSQFREINGAVSASRQTRSLSQIKTIPSRAGSRFTLNSEEDMRFLDVLRGRKLPDEFTGGAVVKCKVRISSRSPMSHGAIKVSEDDRLPQQTWQPATDEEYHDESLKCANIVEAMERSFGQPTEPDRTVSEDDLETSTEDIDRFYLDKRTNSDIAMDKMAMDTILSPPEDALISTSPKGSASHTSLDGTPRGRGRQRSSSDAPETAFKVVHLQNINQTLPPKPRRLQPFLDKPLPPIGDYQRAEVSPRTSEDDDATGALRSILRQGRPSRRPEKTPSFPTRDPSPRTLFPMRHASPKVSFPPRQSSLPTEAPLPMRHFETHDSLAEYRARSDAYMSLPNVSHSRKSGDAKVNEDELPPAGEKRNSVKFLAQQFAEASRANRRGEEVVTDSLVPTVYAYIKPVPSPMSPLEDPFTSLPSRIPSPEKESLIPKPVHAIGRGRKSVSRSPSPPKQTTPRSSQGKPPSVYKIVPDQDAEIVKGNTVMLSESPVSAKCDLFSVRSEVVSSSAVQYLSTRHLSVTSTESHRLPSPMLEEPLMEHHIPKPVTTLARSNSPNRSSSPSRINGFPSANDRARTNSYLDANDDLKALERHGSMNSTLYAEICRLQRMLEQKCEEVLATRRGLDAIRDTYKDSGFADEGKGSWNKGKLDYEVRVAREETGLWKRRAQLAEEQLKGIGGLAGVVAEVGDGGIEEVIRERKDSGTGMMGEKERGVGMDAETKVWGKKDEGDGSADSEGSE